MSTQDLQGFLEEYRRDFPDDVVTVDERVSLDEEITAVVWELAAQGRHELLWFADVAGSPWPVVTNIFACRTRIERMLGASPGQLHERYMELTSAGVPMSHLSAGPVTQVVEIGSQVDLTNLPLLRHFKSDLGPYITSGIIVAEDPETGCGNLSYHRAVVHSETSLATSLHSRGDLWRMLKSAQSRNEPLAVAMVIGAHPLFMLAASARVPAHIDEREIAGGLLGEPLEVIHTPTYGIAVPACAEIVLEGQIDAGDDVDEGPFGEFSGYSSHRSTRNLMEVTAILRRESPIWLDVVGGNSNEHLNLARVPREAEMRDKLMARFPSVRALHYPNSGTHFHAYVAVDETRPGEARQVLLALLGWDPYLKTAIAVDPDIDITDDSEVLWALAVHFQPAQDLFMMDGLPGSALDPSSLPDGTTSRLALDATRSQHFEGTRIKVSRSARTRAQSLIPHLNN